VTDFYWNIGIDETEGKNRVMVGKNTLWTRKILLYLFLSFAEELQCQLFV